MAIYSDFLFTPVAGVMTAWQGVWVRLVNNDTGTAYVSDAATPSGPTATGKFTFTAKPPGGSYTVYTGPTSTGAWTATGETGRVVGYGGGDDLAVKSVTDLLTSPYSPRFPAGATNILTSGTAGPVYDEGGEVYNVAGPKYRAIGTWDPVAGTGDATAAIQQAITDANGAGGGIVFFPKGTYIVNGMTSLTVTTIQNVTFKGAGWGSSLQINNTGTGTQYFFLAGNASITNMVVEDLDLNMLYVGSSWAHFIVGSGTVAGLRWNRVQLRCVNYSGAIPYLVNAAATAARGFTDWHFTKCRFYSPGTQTINGMIIRGFDGLEMDGNEWVNINNPVIPDNIFQKYNLRFTNNYEKYTATNAGVLNMEGFDTMSCEGIVCINNQQWSTVAQSGTSDIGGVLIDTHVGLITDGIVVAGNTFYGNPIQLAPQNGAPVTNCVITGNTIWGTRSTGGGVNSCVQLGADAGTSSGIVITNNTCAGAFTGAPIFIGAGYTAGAITCHDNPGANPDCIQSPTEAVLVSGVTLGLGTYIKPVVLTAARAVGAVINPLIGTRIVFTLIQDGTGGRAVTWNAVYKVSWVDTGNTLNKRSSVAFVYDGTNWNQDGAQVPYV